MRRSQPMPTPEFPQQAYRVFGDVLVLIEGRTHRLEDVIAEMERRLTALAARQAEQDRMVAMLQREVAALRARVERLSV